jgi:hypothetical protein
MKRKLFVEFKYEGGAWELFDWTTVPSWAEEQEQRAKREHPMAKHRVRKEAKK